MMDEPWVLYAAIGAAIVAVIAGIKLWLSGEPWWKSEYERTGKPVVLQSEDRTCWFVFGPDFDSGREVLTAPGVPRIGDPFPNTGYRIKQLYATTEVEGVWRITANCEPTERPPMPETPQIELRRES